MFVDSVVVVVVAVSGGGCSCRGCGRGGRLPPHSRSTSFAVLSREQKAQDSCCTSFCLIGRRPSTKSTHRPCSQRSTDTAYHHISQHSSKTLSYTSPQFTVAAAGRSSSQEEAHSGIRQGCRLSPWDDHARRGRSPHSKRRISPVAVQPEPIL